MRLNRGMGEGRPSSARVGSRATWLVGVGCLLVAGACTSQQPRTPEPVPGKVVDLNGDAQATGPASVQIENQNLSDMTIYLYVGSHRTRLGRAAGNSATRIRIPTSLLSGVTQVRFQAQPLGNRRSFTSEPIPVSPGDLVEFYIPSY